MSHSIEHTLELTPTVVMTGGSRGLGRAIAQRIAQNRRSARVINFSRSGQDAVKQTLEQEGLTEKFSRVYEGKRVHQVGGVDLSKEGEIDRAIDELMERTSGRVHVVGVIACAGEAQLNPENPEKMRQVNCVAPVAMARKLLEHGLLNNETPFMYVGSLAARGPMVPGLEDYAAVKKDAHAQLSELFTDLEIPLCEVDPSVYLTGMVYPGVANAHAGVPSVGLMHDVRAPLEFYGIVPAEALPNNGLVKKVACEIMKGKDASRDIAGPKIPAWYVNTFKSEKARRFALPKFVRLYARQVLEMILPGEENEQARREMHNARIAYHCQNQSYGNDSQFPYDELQYDDLCNPAFSRALTWAGRPFDLV